MFEFCVLCFFRKNKTFCVRAEEAGQATLEKDNTTTQNTSSIFTQHQVKKQIVYMYLKSTLFELITKHVVCMLILFFVLLCTFIAARPSAVRFV